MTFKIYERKDLLYKKGTPLVFIIQPGNIKVQTGIHCQAGSWDQVAQTVIVKGPDKDPDGVSKNIQLKKLSVKLHDLISDGKTIPEIRRELKKKTAEPKLDQKIVIRNHQEYDQLTKIGKEFYMIVERVIQSHQSDWSEGYKKRFRSIRSKILGQDPNFTIDSLTEEWWREFVTYCIEDLDNVSNTINTDAKTIVALMKELGLRGFDKIQWGYIEPEILGLSWDKVLYLNSPELIEKIDYRATLNDSRILWLAGALTGRRWTEISNAGPSNFYKKNGRLFYKNIGKGQKKVDLPLLPEAEEFFKNIDFRLPRLTGQTVNIDIKDICRSAGFKDKILTITPIRPNDSESVVKEEWQTVHFHTGRHSYAQRIVELSKDVDHKEKFVSYMLGHASFQTTWKYLNKYASVNEAIFERIVRGG